MVQSCQTAFSYKALLVWWMVSHAITALIAPRLNMALPEFVGLLLAMGFGAAAALPLIRELSIAYRVLDSLQTTSNDMALHPGQLQLLPGLEQRLNALMTHHAGVGSLRGQLVHQISAAAAQEERNRLARDLHDSIKQQIFSISVSAAAAQAHWRTNAERAAAALNDVRQSAQEAMVEMRAMLQQLSPAPLEKSGLLQALRDQCDALAYRSGAQVETDFGDVPGNDRFTPGAQEALFRIAQEGLSNIARHARAQTVQVRFQQVDDAVSLVITDDGQGFDAASIRGGMGLDNIHKRVEQFGGQVRLESAAGQGTTLCVTLPLLNSTQEDVTMGLMQKMFDQAVPAVYGSALGLGGFIYGISMVLSAFSDLRTPVPPVFVIGLMIFGIVSAVIGVRYFWRGREATTYVSLHSKPGSGWSYRMARHQHQAATIVFGISAWFLPLAWVESHLPIWVTPLVFIPLMGLTLWHFWQTQRNHNRYLHTLHGEERTRELQRRYQERFTGWLSFGFLMGVLFFTGTWNDFSRITLMPASMDQWMTTFFVLASVVLFGQLVYDNWQYRVHQKRGDIV